MAGAMQRSMLEMLSEVREAHQEGCLETYQPTASDYKELAAAASRGRQESRSSALQDCEKASLGQVLRRSRLGTQQQEKQRLLSAFGETPPASARAVASVERPPPTAAAPGRRKASYGGGGLTSGYGIMRSSTQTSTQMSAISPRDLSPQVVHRHHHHHYHHHYVVDDSTRVPESGTVQEPSVQQSSYVNNGSRSARGGGAFTEGSTQSSLLLAPSGLARGGEVQHLHHHHHAAEDSVPPRARRLLEDAFRALSARGAADGPTAEELEEQAHYQASMGPEIRLPRLA